MINEKYLFNFKILAVAEPVKLKIPTDVLKFTFSENNIDATTTEILRVFNEGNAIANVKWIFTDAQIFTVKPQTA